MTVMAVTCSASTELISFSVFGVDEGEEEEEEEEEGVEGVEEEEEEEEEGEISAGVVMNFRLNVLLLIN